MEHQSFMELGYDLTNDKHIQLMYETWNYWSARRNDFTTFHNISSFKQALQNKPSFIWRYISMISRERSPSHGASLRNEPYQISIQII